MPSDQSQYWAIKPAQELPVNDFAKEAVAMLGDEPKTILDLGCGYGVDSFYFAEHGHTVTALDFSETSVERVKERGLTNITPIQHDISEPLPFDDATFDIVYAHLSIHYFDDETTERIVEEIRRVLKPGGYFFVKCKSVDDPLYGAGEKVGEDMFREVHVRHFFSEEYMCGKLRAFDLVQVRQAEVEYADKKSAFIEAIARKKE